MTTRAINFPEKFFESKFECWLTKNRISINFSSPMRKFEELPREIISRKRNSFEFPLGNSFTCYNAMNLSTVVRHPVSGQFSISVALRTDADLFLCWMKINDSIFNKLSSEIHHDENRQRKANIGRGRLQPDRLSLKTTRTPAWTQQFFSLSPDEYQKNDRTRRTGETRRHVKWTKNISIRRSLPFRFHSRK